MSSRTKAALGGKSKSKKSKSKPAHSMHIKRGHTGGFVVTHHHAADQTGMSAPSEDHVVPDMDALHDHLDQAMGDQGPAGQMQPAAAPAPSPAAAMMGGGQ